MSDEKDITSKLINLLNSPTEKIDYGSVIKYANELSRFDKSSVRFKVDAKIVERLGEQLVAKKTTALSELIKNAYDADAVHVDVNFINTEQPFGEIHIFDDGNGMSLAELIKGFMTISTSDKLENPRSSIYLRERAGRKGIGRFSAQKLGSTLTIVTKRKIDEEFLSIEIDWEKFISGVDVSEVANKVNFDRGSHAFDKGTLLIIKGVKEAWTESNIKTTYNYISSLIKVSDIKYNNDPGFDVTFNYKSIGAGNKLITLDNYSEFYSYADLEAKAYMDKSGSLIIDIKGLKEDIPSESLVFSEGFSDILLEVGYEYNAMYFAMEREGSKPKPLQNFLYNNGGIKFYRNGFNVAPYGERFNDWLSLDESSRRRVILPPHANTNFIGSISVSDPEGLVFEETSSREGVIENEAFMMLCETSKNISLKIASHVGSLRKKKVTASQANYKSVKKKKEEILIEKFNNIQSDLQRLDSFSGNNITFSDDVKSNLQEDVRSTQALTLDNIVEQFNEVQVVLKEYIDERILYRVLSSTGLAISEFTHEIQMCIVNMKISSQQISGLAEKQKELTKISSQLEENISMLVAYTDFFDGTMRSNSNREKNNYDLRKVIKGFLNGMNPTLIRRGYISETKFDSWGIWTKKTHFSELMSILMNLFTNSCKAIERSGTKTGKIYIEVNTTNDHIIILFQDNGDGIPKNKWAEVFAPLYTTAMPAKAFSSDNEYTRGMGLGLSITEEIITDLNGEISIVDPSSGFKTCVKIILPKASEDELNDNAY